MVDAKLVRLERLLNNSALSAQAVLTREKHRHRAEITLHARGEKFLHGVGDSASWETSLALAIDKIAQQASKVKGKWQERKRRGPREPLAIDQPEAAAVAPIAPVRRAASIRPRMPRILRTSRQSIKAMSIADAAREVERNGEGVLVFRDVETETISVLCRHDNGELTLVETGT